MKFCTKIYPGLLAGALALVSTSAQAGANPEPTPEYFVGPFSWGVESVKCDALGDDPILIELFIEELWGHRLGTFNQGFTDANGGWHMVQPAHWIMSASSLGGDYSWLGRTAAQAGYNGPSQTYGGSFSYLAHSILRADGDWPDLKLRMAVRVVADANGNFHVFDDSLEITCFN